MADSSHLEGRREEDVGDLPRQGAREAVAEVSRRVLAEGFVGTLEVELRAKPVEASLLGA
jgi:hypothetical protein